MADPDGDLQSDRTQRWDRVPELGGPAVRRPPVPPRRPVPAQDPAPRDPLWRVLVRGAGELLVTAGLVVLLFVVYEVYVTDLLNDRTQGNLAEQIHDQWEQAAAAPENLVAPAVGQPLAVLHIPRLGEDYSRVILEGVSEEQLAEGPGHYIGTALPGQQGNLAIAGHRV